MSKFLKHNYRKYWFSVAINVIMLLFYLLCFNCCYETNDDYGMKLIASGAYGIPDYHLDFINVIYGYILVLLYKIIPDISWYDYTQLLILMFALSNITYILINKSNEQKANVVFLLMSIIAYSFYVSLQFTKSASVATCAGYLCIAYYLETDNKRMQTLGIVMITFGVWLRTNQFLSCSLLCISFFIPYLINIKNHVNAIKKIIITGGICVIVFALSIVINNIEYSSNEWNTYRVYQTKTAQLTDFGWPEYDANRNLYEKVDLDRNAYELYSSWNYNDTNKLNIKEVDILVNESRKKTIDLNYVVTFIYRACNFFLNNKNISYISILIIIILMYTFIFPKKKEFNISLLYLLSSTIVLTAYCYYIRLDSFYNRIEFSFLFIILVFLLYNISFPKINIEKKQIKVLCIVCFVITCLFRVDFINVSMLGIENSINKEKKEVYDNIIKDINHLYLMKVDENVSGYDYRLLINPNDTINISTLGGWKANNPLLLKCLSNYDVINPYTDVIDNDKAYICTKDINRIIKYLQKYYGSSIKAIEVKKIKDYKVYKIENIK